MCMKSVIDKVFNCLYVCLHDDVVIGKCFMYQLHSKVHMHKLLAVIAHMETDIQSRVWRTVEGHWYFRLTNKAQQDLTMEDTHLMCACGECQVCQCFG